MATPKSIFDKSNLINATANSVSKEHGQYNIRFLVNPSGKKGGKNVTVDGILKDNIGWNVTAVWGEGGLENIVSAITGSNPILNFTDQAVEFTNGLAGESFTNTGLFTKKFYKNSGYLTLSPKFRVMDYENKGVPLQASLLFSSLCIPKDTDRNYKITRQDVDFVANAAKRASNAVGSAINVLEGFTQGNFNMIENAQKQNGIGSTMAENYNRTVTKAGDNLVGESINWSGAPDTIDVEIGNWLIMRDVVLDSVNVEFGESYTNGGPQWADFSLSLSTLEALILKPDGTIKQMQMTANGSDVNNQMSEGRVTYGPNQ